MRSFIALGAAALFAATANADLVITEIMQNPSAVSDSNGEWFEVLNTGTTDVNLNGYTFSDNDFDSFTITTDVIIPAGDYFVFGINAVDSLNGGVPVDYEYSSFFLANGADELVITAPDSTEVDRVEWDGGPLFPDPNGASMSLTCYTADNNVGANWYEASLITYGDGDYGTPGAPNEPIVWLTVTTWPDTVSQGSTANFDVSVENPTCDPITTDAWVRAVKDSTVDVTPILMKGLVLPGGFAIDYPVSLPVPGVAPTGTYDVSVNMGDYATDTVNWSDSFMTEVIP